MAFNNRLWLALLITPITALINCSGKNSCYAESPECDPSSECQTVLHFDPSGNVIIYVRNVSVTDYVSIVTDRDMHNTMEYFIWIPFYGQRLRGLGRAGQSILFNQQNLTNVVKRLNQTTFQCIIHANELESDFRQNENFIVARGKFQQFLKVNEGVKLYKVDQEESNTIEDDLKTENFIPIVYNIAAPISKIDKSFDSWKEDPEVSKILRNLEKFVFYHAQNLKPLDIVEALNAPDRLKLLKKQRYQKRNKGQSVDNIAQESTAADDEGVSKKKKVHKAQSLVANKGMNVTRHQASDHKSAGNIKNKPILHEDLDEKIYVRMTKGQMYSFVDGLESSDASKNSTNSNGNHDDDDEEIHVLMTKRQMYTFVDKQAERQVSDPKMVHKKRDNSNQHGHTGLFLLIAVFFSFWN